MMVSRRCQSSIGLDLLSILAFLQPSPYIQPISLIPMHMQCRSFLASTLDEYSRLLCSPLFPLSSSFWLMQPDVGAQEPDDPTDDYYYLEGAYYYEETAEDQEQLGGSQAGGLAFSIDVAFVLAFLRQTCLTYVCTQILLLSLTLMYSSLCIRALEAPGL